MTKDKPKFGNVELSFDGGYALHVRVEALQGMTDEEARIHAYRTVTDVLLCSLGSDGMDTVSPLIEDADVGDLTMNPLWLKWWSEIGPDARKEVCQEFGFTHVDYGQESYWRNGEWPLGRHGYMEHMKKAERESGVGRFLAEYSTGRTHADAEDAGKVEHLSPEFFAREARYEETRFSDLG